jgi:hypothetical protein
VAEIVAVGISWVDEVADVVVHEETDARSTNAHTAKLTIIPLKHVERESTLRTTQTPAVHTLAVQTPPGTTNVLAPNAVSQVTLSQTASTSNVPGINAIKSTKAQQPRRLLEQEIAT